MMIPHLLFLLVRSAGRFARAGERRLGFRLLGLEALLAGGVDRGRTVHHGDFVLAIDARRLTVFLGQVEFLLIVVGDLQRAVGFLGGAHQAHVVLDARDGARLDDASEEAEFGAF